MDQQTFRIASIRADVSEGVVQADQQVLQALAEQSGQFAFVGGVPLGGATTTPGPAR